MNTRLSNEINTVRWQGDSDGHLEILDQTKLPTQIKIIICKDVPAVVESIKLLRVRGAPAIGIAGAYGMVLAVHQAVLLDDSSNKKIAYIQQRAEELATSRPTAVNLRWAIQRIERLIVNAGEHPDFSKLWEASCIPILSLSVICTSHILSANLRRLKYFGNICLRILLL